MESFKQYLEESKGRKSKSLTHAEDKKYILSTNFTDVANMTNKINLTRRQFLAAIEASDKKLVDAEKKSLTELKDFIDKNDIKLIRKRKTDWKKHEKDVADGINDLFKNSFFTIDAGKMTKLKDNVNFKAEVVGGSNLSDVKVSHKDKSFFVECKLNLASSEYFKFGLIVNDNNIIYDHKDFINKNQTDEEILKTNDLFNLIDISGFLSNLVKDLLLNAYWKQFNQNIKDIVLFLKKNDEYKDFVKKNSIGSKYPEAFQLMTKVFELYCNYYISKYNKLIDDLFDLIDDDNIRDKKDDYKIKSRKHSDNIEDSTIFQNLNSLQEEIKNTEEYDPNVITDKKRFKLVINEIKKIEAKITLLLKDLGKDANDFNGLNDIPNDEQLKYFFKLFISSTGRKAKGKNTLLTGYDEEGNMQICPEVIVENSKLGQMITDFYVKKDNCAYIQIEDTIYQLNEKFNPFSIDNLPIFKAAFTKFEVKMLVSDDLKKISLHIKALEADKRYVHKFNCLSFKTNDKNSLFKKVKNIVINVN